MASQPSLIKEDESSASMGADYVNGWAATTKLMATGKSWSGNERNCVYLNCRDGTFVDISSATGLDFLDDGRAVALTDWDGDGDLDLWLKNRTGPQLRFIRNDSNEAMNTIAFDLVGKDCNRDAIGARVTVVADQKSYSRVLFAGDGYLSQSSKRLVIGLPPRVEIEESTITWPDGKVQALNGVKAGNLYQVVRGEAVRPVSRRQPPVIPQRGPEDIEPTSTRLVLKVPLPLAPSLLKLIDLPDTREPTLISLWAQWCKPCHVELRKFLQHRTDFDRVGLQLMAMNIDGVDKQDDTEALWNDIRSGIETDINPSIADEKTIPAIAAIFEHVREKAVGAMPLPLNLLISPDGQLQIIYIGAPDLDQLLEDARTYGRNAVRASKRYQFEGRWYFRVPRDFEGLEKRLRRAGFESAAEFYRLDESNR